jgi:hypothetical protein
MLRYETSLTYFLPDANGHQMTCHVQQSIMYDDQIGLKVEFDSGLPRTDCDQQSCADLSIWGSGPESYIGQFDDEGTHHPVVSKFDGPFVQFVLPSLYEDVKNGDDFEYLIFALNATTTEDNSFQGGPLPESDEAKIFPLDPKFGGDAHDRKDRVFRWCGTEGGDNVPASESVPFPVWYCGKSEFHYTMGYTLTHDDQRKGP